MSGPARFDDSAWPVLVVHMPAVMNMIAIKSVIDGFEDVLRRDQRFALVIDGSGIEKVPGTLERKVLTDWLTDEARVEKERRLTVASAVVVTSGPLRALLAALNWIRRPAAPQIAVATQDEAIEWCCARLTEAGIRLTPAASTLRARPVASAAPARRSR
jgi:hypothetical protein